MRKPTIQGEVLLPKGMSIGTREAIVETMNYPSVMVCDDCGEEHEGTVLHACDAILASGYRIRPVLFLCRECSPNSFRVATEQSQALIH